MESQILKMKPGSYTQLYIHLVIAVKNRDAVLTNKIKDRVCKYLSGILKEKGHKAIIVNGMYDHVHILFGLNPNSAISDLVKELKRNSSRFINKEQLCMGKFVWQEGYAAFSYSKSQLSKVYQYIENQEEHHRRKSFRKEYVQFLKEFDVDYDERYLFETLDEV